MDDQTTTQTSRRPSPQPDLPAMDVASPAVGVTAVAPGVRLSDQVGPGEGLSDQALPPERLSDLVAPGVRISDQALPSERINHHMAAKLGSGHGFVAALDQSGGSTPGALARYGIAPEDYATDAEMFDLIHAMRTRVITSPAFTGEKVLAAILFEDTMDREIAGRPTCAYLWQVKGIVPILKVDKGLAAQADGVRLMKPMIGLDKLLSRAVANGVFGTKMRSVIRLADSVGVRSVVDQQFAVAHRILDAGLVPILEPEVDIHSPEKEDAEFHLRDEIAAHLADLAPGQQVMLKLTLPSIDGFYSELIADPRVLRVVALSGGYSRADADERLARNPGLIASFSRALLEGLGHDQSDEEFDATLATSIDAIYRASMT